MSETNRNARTGVRGDKPAPSAGSDQPKPGTEAVTARQPRRGAYEPAPGATNGTGVNGAAVNGAGVNGGATHGSGTGASANGSAVNGAGVNAGPVNGAATNGSSTKPANGTAKPTARKPMRGGLSAEDYARTTGAAADTTSVIPVVEDEPARSGRKSSAKSRGSKSATGDEAAAAATQAQQSAEPTAATKRRSKSRVSFVTDGPTAQQSAVVDTASTDAPPVPTADVREASLRLAYVDPWSVTRLAFVVSVALMIVAVVAAVVFWVVLAITGVWDNINDSVKNVLSDDSGGFNVGDYLGFWRLIGFALMSSALNVVFMTALATISAHLYNLAAQIMGGFKVSFTEEK